MYGGGGEKEILWYNKEEEIIKKEDEWKFELWVKDDDDYGMYGWWMEDEVEMSK
jgi:hypothetical protein